MDPKVLEDFQKLRELSFDGIITETDDGFECVCSTGIVDELTANEMLTTIAPELFTLTVRKPELIANFTTDRHPGETPDGLSMLFTLNPLVSVGVTVEADGGDGFDVWFDYSQIHLGYGTDDGFGAHAWYG